MSIIYRDEIKSFYLNTKNTTYAFFVNELGVLEHLYYGKALAADDLRHAASRRVYSFTPYRESVGNSVSPDSYLQEFPTANSGDYRIHAFSVKDGEGYFGARVSYRGHEVYSGRKPIDGLPFSRGKGAETLEIVLQNQSGELEVRLYYVVYAELDVIARYAEAVNRSDRSIELLKAGVAFDFYGHDFDCINLYGMYYCERSIVNRYPIHYGMQGNYSTKGASGHETNPFFALCEHNATEDSGEVYGFNFIYSGNFSNEIQVDKTGNTRAVIGIADEGFEWVLNPEESLTTPETIVTYTDCGIGAMSRNMHDFIREEILPPEFAYAHRPVVLNTWEAFYFDIDVKRVTEVGKRAKEMGAELVVIDDGWFRNNDREGLGDWKILREKFPNGIKEASDILHDQGLALGLWFEPEMISERSELYEAHPEWVMGTREEKYLSRNQMVLDMGNPEVVDYLTERIVDCLDGVRIEYMKWDMNRYISEAGSATLPNQGEVFHRYMLGVYELLGRIRKRYPQMLIEGCAGGGGRFDLGMLYYSPQIWTSDNTDPYHRTDIQTGTSLAYPASALSCHYTNSKDSGFVADSDFRFASAAYGSYGYEMDPTAISAEERERLAKLTEEQRRNEDLVLTGDLYRILNREAGEFTAYIQVSKDRSRAVFTFIQIAYSFFRLEVRVKLKGLREDAYYRSSADDKCYRGSVLMNVGLWMDGIGSKGGKAVRIYLEQAEE